MNIITPIIFKNIDLIYLYTEINSILFLTIVIILIVTLILITKITYIEKKKNN